MDAEQPPAGPQRPRQRRDDARRLEGDGHAGAIGLGGDDEVVVGPRPALARNDVVEQEAEVVAVDDQRDGTLVDGVAGLGGVARLPDLGQERLQRLDLLAELGGRAARQRHLVPHQRGGGGQRLGLQPGRLRVVHVGDDQRGGRVLVEAVGHLVEAQARVLEADLLAHHVEGQRREAPVHLAHDAGQHGAVAHAGIEQAHRRRLGVEVGELHADAARHHLLLAAGIDEQQVFLAVVEEAEVARAAPPRRPTAFASRPRHAQAPASSGISSRGAAGASTPWLVRKVLTRSRVSGVMRAPSRRRDTNLPSLTARRPKVDSAMPARRQNSEMLSNSPTAACAIAGVPWVRCWRSFRTYGPCVWEDNHKGMPRRGGTNPNS